MARGDAIRRKNEFWRKRLQAQREKLQRDIAKLGPADPRDFGDCIYRKAQDDTLNRLNVAIQEIDKRLAEPQEEHDGDIGS